MTELLYREVIGIELHDRGVVIGSIVHNEDSDISESYVHDDWGGISKIMCAIGEEGVLHIRIYWDCGVVEISYNGSYSVWWRKLDE